MTLAEAARDFLDQKRIAVVGVSRDPGEAANFILRKLRDTGHEVFPVNPHAATLEDTTCYARVGAIPDGVDAVVVFTPATAAATIVRECADLGISRIWLHRSTGTGSVSAEAIRIAGEHRLTLIPGGCPAMFCAPVDVPHRCMRWILNLTGHLPRQVSGGERDAQKSSA